VAEGTLIHRGLSYGVQIWGSECLRCGNTTPGTMQCDNCKQSDRTTPLWIKEDLVYDPE
jgi:hypothetical protein